MEGFWNIVCLKVEGIFCILAVHVYLIWRNQYRWWAEGFEARREGPNILRGFHFLLFYIQKKEKKSLSLYIEIKQELVYGFFATSQGG